MYVCMCVCVCVCVCVVCFVYMCVLMYIERGRDTYIVLSPCI